LSVVLSSRYIWPLKIFPISLRALCTWGMEVPLCEHLVKTICIKWRSMVILSWVAWGVGIIDYRAWDIQLVRGQTYKTTHVFTNIDMSCIIKKLFSLLVSKSWHVYSLLTFNFHCLKERRKERRKSSELHKHLHA
jgi:hypothetical protein